MSNKISEMRNKILEMINKSLVVPFYLFYFILQICICHSFRAKIKISEIEIVFQTYK